MEKCPKCGGDTKEARFSFGVNGRAKSDRKGSTIKTTCAKCGVFIGYRPVAQEPLLEGKRRRKAK